jgi:hypothetical protein
MKSIKNFDGFDKKLNETAATRSDMTRGYPDEPNRDPWTDEDQESIDHDNRSQLVQTFKNLANEIEGVPDYTTKGEYEEVRQVLNYYMKSALSLLKAIKHGVNITDIEEDPYVDIK